MSHIALDRTSPGLARARSWLLGGVAHLALPAPYATALEVFGLVYGLPLFGLGMLWIALVVALTVRASREHLPFSLTWWSFTFPTGLVTGTSALALHTGSRAWRYWPPGSSRFWWRRG